MEKKQQYRGQKDEDQDKYDLLFDYPSSGDQSEGKGGKRRERSDVPLRRDGSLESQGEKYGKNHSHDRYKWQARNDRRSKDERRERSDRNDNRKKYERNHSRDRYERLDRYDKQDKERS